jgi:Spy/CpxP family protein refolding chaperone
MPQALIAAVLAAAIAATPAAASSAKAPKSKPPPAGSYSGGWGPHHKGSHFTPAPGSGTYHPRHGRH